MSNPAPGTGVTYNPQEEIKQPVKLSPSSVEAGVMQPEGNTRPRGVLIKQISEDEAINDLEEIGVDEWVVKHYNAGDFNIQNMSKVLRETIEDVYNRLHVAGISLPEGTFSQ